jgi:hypothetical protein
MDKLQIAIDKGQRAKNILDDGLFQEAKEHIEAEIYRKFCEAIPDDERALKHIKSMQYFHTKYLAFLHHVIQDGKLAAFEVERENKLKRTLRKVIG